MNPTLASLIRPLAAEESEEEAQLNRDLEQPITQEELDELFGR